MINQVEIDNFVKYKTFYNLFTQWSAWNILNNDNVKVNVILPSQFDVTKKVT